jgi:ATP-dependent DNA helicase RecG
MLDLKIADLAKDGPIVVLARDQARLLLEKDPDLSSPQCSMLREILKEALRSRPNWGKIA